MLNMSGVCKQLNRCEIMKSADAETKYWRPNVSLKTWLTFHISSGTDILSIIVFKRRKNGLKKFSKTTSQVLFNKLLCSREKSSTYVFVHTICFIDQSFIKTEAYIWDSPLTPNLKVKSPSKSYRPSNNSIKMSCP